MSIKKAGLSDLDRVYEITQMTIGRIYPHYYAKGAVEFFLEHHSRSAIAEDIQAGVVFLCQDSQHNTVGTVTLRDDEICRLFVLPDFQNKGFGRELLDYAEKTIFSQYPSATLSASLPAKRIYRKRGYKEIESDVIPTHHNDFLCYDVMEKQG